tara:strand:+ start:255 stop:386 length:132 start_codon:yes stop_codon:yes gene_type:complete
MMFSSSMKSVILIFFAMDSFGVVKAGLRGLIKELSIAYTRKLG